MTTTTTGSYEEHPGGAHPVAQRSARSAGLPAGLVAGLIGGVLMGVWSMSYAASQGLGFWLPMKLIAGTWFGVDALIGGAGVLIAGMLTHLAVSAGYGAVFGTLLPARAGVGAGLVAGLAYGMVILLAMTFVVLPWLDELMRERVDLIWFSWIVTHAIFGASMSLVPLLRRRWR